MDLNLLPVFILGVFIQKVTCQCEVAFDCVTDVTSSICASNQYLQPNSHIFNCCPRCENSVVTSTLIPGPITQTKCEPPADCLPDGRFAPVQCKGDIFVGRCFCVDENGKRIFGQMWRDEEIRNPMNCACSRRRAQLEASGRDDVTLHCTPNGDYEELQCDNGLCWCAEPKTGQPTAIPVNEQDMKLLSCYSLHTVGEQYLRKCESLVKAMATIRREQQEHNTNFLRQVPQICDYDGSYGAYIIQGTSAFCANRFGEVLGSWQVSYSSASDVATMNCNCARDTAIYFPARDMSVSESCQGNGNYAPNQNIAVGDTISYYCVDTDGYPTTDYLTAWPTDLCASFA